MPGPPDARQVDAPAGGPDTGSTFGARPSLRVSASAVGSLAVLVAVAFRRGFADVNADSLIYGLMSTEHLTFFYWGQDRLANVVPAIAWPVQDLRWNHLVQTTIIAVSFFGLVAAFVWFHATRAGVRRDWPVLVVSSTITGAIALAVLSGRGVYVFVLEQQYALSTLLFLAGLAAVLGGSTRGRVLGATSVIVAVLLIPSTCLLLPAVVALQRGPTRPRRVAGAAAVAIAAFLLSSSASRTLADPYPLRAEYSDFSFDRLGRGWRTALDGLVASMHGWPALALFAACVAVLLARRRTLERPLRRAYLLCPLVAVGWVALFASNAWVERNAFAYRYFFPAYAAGLLLLAGAVTECTAAAWRPIGRLRAPGTAVAVTGAAAGIVAAVMSTAAIDAPALDEGDMLADTAAASDAELIVGDYWRVWPAMFSAREHGRRLIAVSTRSAPLVDQIVDTGRRQSPVAALCITPDAESCVDELNRVAGPGWTLATVRSAAPLVIELSLDG